MSSVKVTHQAKKKKVKGVADISCAGKTKVKQGLRRTKLSQKKKKKKEEIKERKGSHFPQREYDLLQCYICLTNCHGILKT